MCKVHTDSDGCYPKATFHIAYNGRNHTRIANVTFSPLVTISLQSYCIHIFASDCVNFDL